jgi:uncharacterized membrane protein
VKKLWQFIGSRFVAGVLVVAPIYLAALLLLKAVKSVAGMVKPVTKLLPHWLRDEHIVALLAVLTVCFLIGLVVRTSIGRAAWEHMEGSFLQRVPGYSLIRGFTRQLAGEKEGSSWKPALAEIEEALVPAFIIEELADGRFTVFVPSVPTPMTGTIYILTPDRVHPLNISLTQELKSVCRWGEGSQRLVDAMEISHPRVC